MLRLHGLTLLLWSAFGALSLSAQIVSGTIAGSVKDSSGAAIPGAKVGLVNTETNLSRESASNESGDFIFSTLPPGKYQVTASHAGFKEFFNILNNVNFGRPGAVINGEFRSGDDSRPGARDSVRAATGVLIDNWTQAISLRHIGWACGYC